MKSKCQLNSCFPIYLESQIAGVFWSLWHLLRLFCHGCFTFSFGMRQLRCTHVRKTETSICWVSFFRFASTQFRFQGVLESWVHFLPKSLLENKVQWLQSRPEGERVWASRESPCNFFPGHSSEDWPVLLSGMGWSPPSSYLIGVCTHLMWFLMCWYTLA